MINFRDAYQRNSQQSARSSLCSDRAAQALMKVGESLHVAVERFVSVGEKIAYENQMIKTDMLDACKQARVAGLSIRECTRTPSSVANIIGLLPSTIDLIAAASSSKDEKLNMIQAANNLLNSVTHILLLADVVIINQILNSKNKVRFMAQFESLDFIIISFSDIQFFFIF